jgi:predicted alpha/beta-hydrolase family hydrolase
MEDESVSIPLPSGGAVSALWQNPAGGSRGLFVYAPGAGSSLDDPFGVYLGEGLPRAGIAILRFQFPYMEAGRRSPDAAPVLEATWRAAIGWANEHSRTVVVGGRSMGGRIASQVVARGVAVAGLALFAYPLRPPGRPDSPRDAHLPSIEAPTLFCSGSRDAFAAPDDLAAAAAKVAGAQVHLLDGADHGFNVLKASGRTRRDVWQEACEALLEFWASLA